MQDVLSKDGGTAARELLSWLQGSREFISEQAPDFSRQLLEWGYLKNMIGFWILLFISCVFLIIAGVLYAKYLKEREYGGLQPIAFFAIFGVIIGGVSIVPAVEAVKCKSFPKVYVVETIADYLKRETK